MCVCMWERNKGRKRKWLYFSNVFHMQNQPWWQIRITLYPLWHCIPPEKKNFNTQIGLCWCCTTWKCARFIVDALLFVSQFLCMRVSHITKTESIICVWVCILCIHLLPNKYTHQHSMQSQRFRSINLYSVRHQKFSSISYGKMFSRRFTTYSDAFNIFTGLFCYVIIAPLH